MPSLIPEIWFAVGKKLIEDGDSDAMLQFALSGKQQFQVMKNILTSAKHLELFEDHFVVRWDNHISAKTFQNNELFSKLIMHYIGNSVTSFHLNYFLTNCYKAIYHPVFNTIIKRKQLVTFTISPDSHTTSSFLDKFLPIFASTLKNVAIPSFYMTPTFRDSFNLDSLTVWDAFDDHLTLFCCKTTSLTLAYHYPYPLHNYDDFVLENPQFNPLVLLFEERTQALFSVKQLIFDHINHDVPPRERFEEVMKYFPSLELIKFTCTPRYAQYIRLRILSYTEFINAVVEVPPKIVLKFNKMNENVVFFNLEDCERYCIGFELDESILDFYCFRKNFQLTGGKSTIFEVQFPF